MAKRFSQALNGWRIHLLQGLMGQKTLLEAMMGQEMACVDSHFSFVPPESPTGRVAQVQEG